MGLCARSTAIAGISIVALLGPLAPADAAALPPIQAPLLNAAGEPSGCTVRVSAPSQFMANDGLREGYGMTVTCDKVWTRLRIGISKVEVLPNGTIPPDPGGGGSLSPGNTALTKTIRSNWLCSVTPGTHEYVFRATAKVSTGLGDPNVYKAKVARRASFTCP